MSYARAIYRSLKGFQQARERYPQASPARASAIVRPVRPLAKRAYRPDGENHRVGIAQRSWK
jgi:hypothetical protein